MHSKLKHSINYPKIGIILACRLGSTRLPNKGLLEFGNKPMVFDLYARLKTSKLVNIVIIATTTLESDNRLSEFATKYKCDLFRGHPTDLIQRYLECQAEYNLDYLIRVTADCPFVSGELIDHGLSQIDFANNYDLITTKSNFPVGLDFEIINAKTLKKISLQNNLSLDDKEHLTLYFYNNKNKFKIKYLANNLFSEKISKQHFTIDTHEDYAKLIKLRNQFQDDYFTLKELIHNASDLF